LIPPAILALLQDGVTKMLWVIVLYSVINFVVQSLIQPKFVGDAVGLSVTLTFLSLVFWSWVMGALGAILAIPLTLLTKALLIDIDPNVRWVNQLITSGAGPPDEDSAAERTEREVDKTVEREPTVPEPSVPDRSGSERSAPEPSVPDRSGSERSTPEPSVPDRSAPTRRS
jgi:AI-2E family transporter